MRLDLYVGNLKYAKVKVQFQLLIPLIMNLNLEPNFFKGHTSH